LPKEKELRNIEFQNYPNQKKGHKNIMATLVETPAAVPSSAPTTKGIIYPPLELRNIIDRTAKFVAEAGVQLEKKIAETKSDNPKFSFLKSSDPYWAYYQFKLKEYGSANVITASSAAEADDTTTKQEPVVIAQLQKPEDPIFLIKRPPNLNALDVDIIKLTAQFMARNGPDFVQGLLTRERANPQFEFVKPSNALHGYFRKLVDVYQLCITPPAHVTKRVEEIAKDPSSVLKRCDNRAQYELQEEKQLKMEKEAEDKDRVMFSSIDWHDFVVVGTIDFEEDDNNLPAPDKSLHNRSDLDQHQNSVPPPPRPATTTTATSTTHHGYAAVETEDGDMDVEMNEDDVEMEDNDDDDEAPMIIRKEPLPNPAFNPRSEEYLISPITNQPVKASELAEHMRLGLLDPKWREQREAMQSKQAGTALANAEEIAANLGAFAQKRKDFFGDKNKEVQKEEEAKWKATAEKVIWDGHSDSVARTTNAAIASNLYDSQGHKKQYVPPPPSDISIGPLVASRGVPPLPPLPPPIIMSTTSLLPVPIVPSIPLVKPIAPPLPPLASPISSALSASVPPPPPAAHSSSNIATSLLPPPPPLPGNSIAPLAFPSVPTMPPLPPMPIPPVAASDDEPATKRHKTADDEIQLMLEEQFAQQFPSNILIHIKLPLEANKADGQLNGQTLKISVAIRDSISSLKEKIKDECGLAPPKQNLIIDGLGFLKNDKTVAFYNLRPGQQIILSVKERGKKR
jgi:splicing factor 3A subunit 1